MEFDKSKILTVVTGNKELEGKFGWFGDTPNEIKENMSKKKPGKLLSFDETCSSPFEDEYFLYNLFYPAPEPTYRPFKNAEEFEPYRDEWFRVKNGGGFDSVRYYDNDGVKDSTGNFITYQKLFEAGERENGEPCGVKEEA